MPMELGSFSGTYHYCEKIGHKWSHSLKLHESATRYQELLIDSRGKSSPKTKEKVNRTKWHFWVQTLVLVWLVVRLELLDGMVLLGCKFLSQL